MARQRPTATLEAVSLVGSMLSHRPHRLTAGIAIGLLASMATPHGIITKFLFNGATKVNGSTRGASATQGNQLYMMMASAHVTGDHTVVGYEVFVQDQEASTPEMLELSLVKFASNGVNPDETPGGELHKASFNVFGFFAGRQAFQFLLTIGSQITIPRNHGVGIGLLPDPAWPTDGLSVQAQLNLPGDPLRPRVPPPHDTSVWAFERPPGATQAAPLGGRTLDTLAATPGYFGSILQVFNDSTAYGGARERLTGPEAIYPVASRGDQVGINIHGRDPAGFPVMVIIMAPRLSTNPPLVVQTPFPGYLYIEPFPPIVLSWHALDFQGKATVGPFPLGVLPPGIREWYFQGINLSVGGLFEMSDAVGFLGQ